MDWLATVGISAQTADSSLAVAGGMSPHMIDAALSMAISIHMRAESTPHSISELRCNDDGGDVCRSPRGHGYWLMVMLCLFACVTCVANTNTASPLSIANGDFQSTNGLSGWRFLKSESIHAEAQVENTAALNRDLQQSLRLTITNAEGRCVVVTDANPLKLDTGTWYDLRFSAKSDPTNRGFGLVISLETSDGRKVCGRATIPEIGGEWKQHTLAIPARHSTTQGRLSIAMFEVGTVWLDDVSLSPRQASE